MGVKHLVEELRERSVIRAMVTYAVVAWMLLQVADVTFDRLPIPDVSMTVLIALVIAGFPITFVLAWGYEITVAGVIRHEHSDGGAPRLGFAPFIVLVIAITIGAGGLFYYISQEFWEPPRRSLAVLPVVDVNADEDAQYFSDGLTEEIQNLIVRLNEFRVVALSTSYQLKETDLDIVSIAKRLGADVILQGSVRRYENRVSVTARLVDGDDGSDLWFENYNSELHDLFEIQQEIAHQVARSLHVVLPVAAKHRLKRLGTKNVEAYDLYLRGRDYLRKPAEEKLVTAAEQFLRQSVALDPQFGNAHAALCEVYLARYELQRNTDSFGAAEQACQRALDHDNDSSDVHLALGGLYKTSGKNEIALQEYELALAKNSNSVDAHIGLAGTYVAQGRIEDAEASLRRAIEIDVTYWASFKHMGNFLFDQGRYLEAAEFYLMFLSRADDDANAFNNLGAAYYFAGDFSRAAQAWENSLQIRPTRSAYSNTGSMYFYLGDYKKAAARYAKAVNLASLDYRLWGNLGDSYFYAEDLKPTALVAYKRSIEVGEQQLTVNPSNIDAVSDLAYYYAHIDNIAKSNELHAKALATAPDNMYVQYNSALIHAYLGDVESALSALERAVTLDYQPELLAIDPAFTILKDEERFRRLFSGNQKKRR
jgi:TolB-like protein/Flp pilus assembly protein TadD